MPFWTKVKRCENCAHWRPEDPSVTVAVCGAPVPDRMPFWAKMVGVQRTQHDDGKNCPAYVHTADRDHPLDGASDRLIRARVGDRVPMRTYNRTNVGGLHDVATAVVMRHNKQFVSVRLLNTDCRIRIYGTERELPGTVIGWPDWGVDMSLPIEHMDSDKEDMTKAPAMLENVRKGDVIPLIGYPPFDRMRKTARILVAGKDHLTIKVGRRKAKMRRTGSLAGLIDGEIWVLDTTGSTTNEQAQAGGAPTNP